jgi:hypothetical protein
MRALSDTSGGGAIGGAAAVQAVNRAVQKRAIKGRIAGPSWGAV